MWKLHSTTAGYQRFSAKLMIFNGPVQSGQIWLKDYKDDDQGEVPMTVGDFNNVKILFDQLVEACQQNNARGWAVMKAVYASAKAMSEAKALELDVDDELASAVESKIESYGIF